VREAKGQGRYWPCCATPLRFAAQPVPLDDAVVFSTGAKELPVAAAGPNE
jgi:hypothetical protein